MEFGVRALNSGSPLGDVVKNTDKSGVLKVGAMTSHLPNLPGPQFPQGQSKFPALFTRQGYKHTTANAVWTVSDLPF